MSSAIGLSYRPLYGVNYLGAADFNFSFVTNGTGAVDQTTIRGMKVASVTRSAAGKFTCVLDSGVYQVVAASAEVLENATGSPRGLQASVQIADEAADPLSLVVYTFPLPKISTATYLQTGTATLASGTVTVSGVTLTSGSRIVATVNTGAVSSATAVGARLEIPSASRSTGAGTFVINSVKETDDSVLTTDVSTVDWMIFTPSTTVAATPAATDFGTSATDTTACRVNVYLKLKLSSGA